MGINDNIDPVWIKRCVIGLVAIYVGTVIGAVAFSPSEFDANVFNPLSRIGVLFGVAMSPGPLLVLAVAIGSFVMLAKRGAALWSYAAMLAGGAIVTYWILSIWVTRS